MFKKLWEKIKGFKTEGFACGGIIEDNIPKLPPFKPGAFVKREPILSGGKQFWVVQEVLSRGIYEQNYRIRPEMYVVGYYEDREIAEAAAKKCTAHHEKEWRLEMDNFLKEGEENE